MIDKRFCTGAIAVVTLIVAGAGALPELLLRPAPTERTVVLPLIAPKAASMAKPEQPAAILRSAPVPAVDPAEIVTPRKQSAAEATPQVVAAAPESPKPEPEVAAPSAPAPSVAFPPVQPVGVPAATAKAPAVTPQAKPQAPPVIAAQPATHKPVQSESTVQRPAKPRRNARPAVYPMAEFLISRR